jgi:hypothetical protein
VSSPSYDIWTLGCVYLDFITWYLGDDKHIVDFGNRRLAIDNDDYWGRMKTDTFFTIEMDSESTAPRAKVKESVTEVTRYTGN